MSEEKGLVRRVRVDTDQLGGAFFHEAYRAVRAVQPDRQQDDADRLQGCLLHIAIRDRLDIHKPDAQAACVREVGAALTLGLAEASRGELGAAITILTNTPIDQIIEVGLALHRELKEQAGQVLRANIMDIDGRWYGILDMEDEIALREITAPDHFLEERSIFLAAGELVARARRLLAIAAFFPFAYTFASGNLFANFYREAFSRPNIATPSSRGGILGLFVRSYIIKALADPELKLPIDCGFGHEFITTNFFNQPNRLRALVTETFFDPSAVGALVPNAAMTFDRYFTTPLGFADTPSFHKVRVRSEALRIAGAEFAKRCLEQFVTVVRAYFRTAQEVEISDDHLNAFWATWILAYGPHVNAGSIAQAAGGQDIDTLLRTPPRDLDRYLAGVPAWPADVRARFLADYSWIGILRSDWSDEIKIITLRKAADALGSEVVERAGVTPMSMTFWVQAWASGSPALRDGILRLVQGGRMPRRMTLRKFIRALSEGIASVGGDTRLLAWVIGEAVRQGPTEYVERGVGVEGWVDFLYSLVSDRMAICLAYQAIPPRMREHVLEALPSEPHRSISLVLRDAGLLG